jgi:hypothetical protein
MKQTFQSESASSQLVISNFSRTKLFAGSAPIRNLISSERVCREVIEAFDEQ